MSARKDVSFGEISKVNSLFFRALELGWDSLYAGHKGVFFERF